MGSEMCIRDSYPIVTYIMDNLLIDINATLKHKGILMNLQLPMFFVALFGKIALISIFYLNDYYERYIAYFVSVPYHRKNFKNALIAIKGIIDKE